MTKKKSQMDPGIYAYVGDSDLSTGDGLYVRGDWSIPWGKVKPFNLDEAEDLAYFILEEVDKSRKRLSEVERLKADIEAVVTKASANTTWDDIAKDLYEKGYRKNG